MKIDLKKLANDLIFISALFYFSSSFLCITFSWGKYAMLLSVFACVLFYCISNGWIITLQVESYHRHIYAITLFFFCSCLWAWNLGEALSKSITLLEISICMTLLYMCFSNIENGERMLAKIIIFAGYAEWIFLVFYYGLGTIMNSSIRLSGDVGNANYIGMLMAMSIITTVYFILFEEFKVYYIFSVVNIYFLAISQSRTALIGTVVGVFILLILKCLEQRHFLNIILNATLYFGVFILAVYFLSKASMFEEMNDRIHNLIVAFTGQGTMLNGERSVSIRETMIEAGIEQFKSNPILGIGIGNGFNISLIAVGRNTYLHNNFIEILVDVGIVGFALYYSFYFSLIKNIARNYRYRTKMCYLVVALMASQLLMDYGSVSYYMKDTYYYLMFYYIVLRNMKNTYSM